GSKLPRHKKRAHCSLPAHQFVTERPSVAQYHAFMTFRFFPKNLLQKIHSARQPFYNGAFRQFSNLS
ncbi:hypothetical protein OC610_28960, partial [Pseudomonas sp. SAICEU22]